VVIVGQLIVAMSYSSLASRWPIAGGIYQWSKRLIGVRFGWWAGWWYVWALILSVSLTTYTGAIFLGSFVGMDSEPVGSHIFLALILVGIGTFVNAIGLRLLKYVVNFGIAAEAIASLTIGGLLLVAYRAQPVSNLWADEIPAGKSFVPAFVACIALSAWMIVGFDACGAVAEETKDAKRQVPRAMVTSIIVVGFIDIVAALAFTLGAPAGQYGGDPVSHTVHNALGSWAEKPFLAIILISFTACCIATQGAAARVIFSLSRDLQLPGARAWRTVTKWNQSPTYAVLLVAVLASIAFTYANAMTVIVTFTGTTFYIGFLCPVGALLYMRLKGRWEDPEGMAYDRGRRGNLIINIVAAAWLTLQVVNIAWPRWGDLRWYENWGAFIGLLVFGVVGGLYYVISKPHRRVAPQPTLNDFVDTAELDPAVRV
jgi:amino acid transporter